MASSLDDSYNFSKYHTEHPILPITGQNNILITSALPYVNNVPHLGNLIGCVLSADSYSRYCKLKGYNTLYVCGTDEYGTATENKAISEKMTPQEICNKYYKLHIKIYEWFNIKFDIFGRTSTPKQTEISQDLFKLIEANGYTSLAKMDQWYCNKCTRFLADRFVKGTCITCKYIDARGDQCDACGRLINPTDLLNPQCSLCNETPNMRETEHIFLELPAIENRLKDWFSQASIDGVWSPNAITTTNSWFKEGLKSRCITRDLKWGVRVPRDGFENKVFYVWFDAPIGYISITALYTEHWKQWWQNPENVKLYQFMAKDNIPFHTVVFPSCLLATHENYTKLHHISSTEYLNYEGGKFSKSRGVGVFGDHAMESGIESEVWRYYLLVNRPEVSDSVFLWDDFAAKNNTELLNNLGNLVNRTLTFVTKKFGGIVPPLDSATFTELEHETISKISEQVKDYMKSMEAVKLKDGLKTAMGISRIGNEYMQHSKAWELFNSNQARCGQCIHFAIQIIHLLNSLLQPFMPTFCEKVAKQLNLDISLFHLRFDSFNIVEGLFSVNHKLGEVVPLFRKILAAEVDELRNRFAGSQSNNGAGGGPYSNVIEFPLDLAVGKIAQVTAIENSDKLYLLQVNLGPLGIRPIVSGLKSHYSAAELEGKNVVAVLNLKPVKMAGVQSCGLLLTGVHENTCGLLTVANDLEVGTKVAPKGCRVVAPPKFDLKNQLPLLPFSVKDGQLYFADIPVQAGQPNLGIDHPSIIVERVQNSAKIC